MDLKKKEKQILEFLKRGEKVTETEMAYQVTCSSLYLKHYLEDLEKKKLVEKELGFGKNGMRVTFWKLTAEGEKYGSQAG